MVNIKINQRFKKFLIKKDLVSIAEIVLGYFKTSVEQEVTIVVEDDEFIRNLNKDFLGNDTPTDVLSFPVDEVDPESQRNYLGDIIISYPRAAEQAAKSEDSIKAEITLLIIHGILHLHGYDHSDEGEKREMWKLQDDLLSKLNVTIKQLPES